MSLPLLWVPAHHGEPGDPVLMEWIKHQIDVMLGLGDWALVAISASVVVAIPIGILGFFILQRTRGQR